ncbi:MAG TPA: heterodisulfide reductase-related iron-sulfur binding cluster [Aggregatilinea sp.]|uniref:(Fe-S)-binding protein n=1 Tax=Aggregatilinea sp. TaxID=2806333 RepID=UPI002C5AFB02|nr:heterodisulfide reductase-related iron-sulfur binding cluster [Aggregatilinea sp.]HML21094.1 heterodisulfide reductase-related iron-sulfur binding cluster [Aggregatilinea sp.]
MLTPVEMILFLLAVAASLYLTQRTFRQAAAVINRGEGQLYTDNLPRRMWRAVEVAVTQRTVLRSRTGTSIMHAFIVWGFLFYFLVNVGDVLEGYFDIQFLGDGLVGGLYRFVADVLSVLVLAGMIYFLVRRFWVKSPALTFHDNIKLLDHVQPGIRRDSLIVGVFILVHVGARFLGRTFWVADEWGDPWQPFAGLVARLWDGLDTDTLVTMEHLTWWLALGAILAFIPYFPYTKHMHLFMGPLNYFTRPERTSLGELPPLDFEDDEREQFGAAKLEHLHKTQIFDAFACIMCNRCQDACPAYVTGKELSPSALEVNKRYEIKSNMVALATGAESPRSLLDFAITPSAVWACTACGACVDICPVGNEPMFDIMDIRRNQVLVDGDFPAELQGAFKGMENSGNPWQMSQSRMQWAEGLDVPTVDEVEDYEILYWVGCAASLEPRAQQTARALVNVLHKAGVKFAVLGERESCTGDSARRAGNEYLFYEMAMANIETLNEVNPPRILVTCPHCFHTLGKEYQQFGGKYDVVHHTEYLDELIRDHRLAPGNTRSPNVTFHDPCYLGRHNDVTDAPRHVLEQVTGGPLLEMERSGKKSFCCGAGGAQFWKEEEPGTARVNLTRYAEAKETGAATLAVGCPFCMRMLTDAGNDASGAGGPVVKDVVEILAEQMGIDA